MDVEKFKALDLHGKHHSKTDHPRTPFVITKRAVERDRSQIFGCDFDPFLPISIPQVVATCGGRHVNIYEVPLDENVVKLTKALEISSQDEDLYTVCWALDPVEVSRDNEGGAHRLVTGGLGSIIYVIDPGSGKLQNRLQSAGGAINELRRSPANSALIACASKDRTVRVFHIRNDACLITIGGMDCHRDQVLSVDWGLQGDYLVTCALDHMAMKFDLSTPYIVNHMEAACKALASGPMNVLNQSTKLDVEEVVRSRDEDKKDEYRLIEDHSALFHTIETLGKPKGCMLCIYCPSGVCKDLHEDYVDCIRVVPGTPYVLSKGCGSEKAIQLWRFGTPKEIKEKRTHHVETSITLLMTFSIPNGAVWFTRFALDPMRRWLVAGGSNGRLNFFDMRLKKSQDPVRILDIGRLDLRNMAFSAHGRVLIIVNDPGILIRMDRVPESVDSELLAEALRK